MSNKKISGLPFVGTMAGDEFWHIIQGGVDRRTSMSQFVEYLQPFLRGDQGVGISSATITQAGDLSLLLSDGSTHAVGNIKGPQGQQGEQGPQGLPGNPGAVGAQGLKGDKGDRGDTGARGMQGIQGAQGIQGIQGLPGADGAPGAAGAKGDQGVKGDKGDQGIQGIAGSKGDTGDQGLPGAKGDQGAAGPKGDTGSKGDQGATGPQGVSITTAAVNGSGRLIVTLSDGTSVDTGYVVGPQGTQGIAGLKGDTGSQGPAGAQWLSGTGTPATSLGSNGDFFIDSSNGTYYRKNSGSWFSQGTLNGPQGPQGPKGDKGDVGPQGATGATGGVTSVAGRTGAITLTSADVSGIGSMAARNVTISTAQPSGGASGDFWVVIT